MHPQTINVIGTGAMFLVRPQCFKHSDRIQKTKASGLRYFVETSPHAAFDVSPGKLKWSLTPLKYTEKAKNHHHVTKYSVKVGEEVTDNIENVRFIEYKNKRVKS